MCARILCGLGLNVPDYYRCDTICGWFVLTGPGEFPRLDARVSETAGPTRHDAPGAQGPLWTRSAGQFTFRIGCISSLGLALLVRGTQSNSVQGHVMIVNVAIEVAWLHLWLQYCPCRKQPVQLEIDYLAKSCACRCGGLLPTASRWGDSPTSDLRAAFTLSQRLLES